MPSMSEMLQSKYIRQEDVEEEREVTIDYVQMEDMPVMAGKPAERKPVAYFRGEEKGMVLNKSTVKDLAEAFGSTKSEDWNGKKVIMWVNPDVSFGNKRTGGLRLKVPKAPKAKAAAQTPPPEQPNGLGDPLNDRIPF